ncbi:MAG: PqqD family protein [Anaerolineae bacterium]|nr:PqqD family protein [Anaerolineae bacterium]
MSSSAYRSNAPNVVSEIIDGEAVIVHLGTGVYYSVDRSGAAIWSLIEQGTPLDAIVVAVAAHYGRPAAEIEPGVQAFAAELLAEGLIVPIDAPPTTAPVSIEASGAWQPPTLGRYTDMEDLLLLDPIHDVDEAGWPNAKGTGL